MNLQDAKVDSVVKVIKIDGNNELRRRFLDLGIITGTKIKVLFESPLGDPRAYLIRGTVLAIREEEGAMIKVSNIK